ncbi:hypothetical protein ABZP36_017472 [Zizania latifolia]
MCDSRSVSTAGASAGDLPQLRRRQPPRAPPLMASPSSAAAWLPLPSARPRPVLRRSFRPTLLRPVLPDAAPSLPPDASPPHPPPGAAPPRAAPSTRRRSAPRRPASPWPEPRRPAPPRPPPGAAPPRAAKKHCANYPSFSLDEAQL